MEIAQCRTGSGLTKYPTSPTTDRFPDLGFWATQAPPSWPR
jgi:hypothetical protein